MTIIHDFEKHNFISKEGSALPIINKKRYDGKGIGDIAKSIGDFMKNNKDIIESIGSTASSAGKVVSSISEINKAIKSAQELNDLKIIRKNRDNKTIKESKSNQKVIDKVLEENFAKGDGFYKITS